MSAITIAEKTMNSGGCFPKEFLELLYNKYPSLPPVEEMISEPEISIFFQEPNVIKSKNNKLSIEERRGLYDDKKCDKCNEKLSYDGFNVNGVLYFSLNTILNLFLYSVFPNTVVFFLYLLNFKVSFIFNETAPA